MANRLQYDEPMAHGARLSLLSFAFTAFAVLAACSSSPSDDGVGGDEPEGTPGAAVPASGVGTAPDDREPPEAGEPDASAPDGGGAAGDVTPQQLLALVSTCTKKLSSAPYATDEDEASNLDVCGLQGAVFWKADMDIDCDGKASTTCSKKTDPSYLPETAASDSKGAPLDAAKLPYVVVPLASARFDYAKAGLRLGNVVAVIYKGKVEYGVLGDLGPASILGEASYAMAKNLGINPNPATGGVDSGVTYIAFTGTTAKITPIEDHSKAVQAGKTLAKKLVADNP